MTAFRSVLGQHRDSDRPRLRLLLAERIEQDRRTAVLAADIEAIASVPASQHAIGTRLGYWQHIVRRLAKESRVENKQVFAFHGKQQGRAIVLECGHHAEA